MNVVVTCGPAYEPIDEVRRITNFSTGRLGIGLANHLTAQGHHVTCLVGHHATHRGQMLAARTQTFTTAESLAGAMRALARSADAIFHAAAVSDFTVARIECPDGQTLQHTKIPSGTAEVRVILKPTPKILPLLRGWFPGAFLVGWKYELDGDRATAIARATEQVIRCQTDLCVVNGRAFGPGFGLCDASGLIDSVTDHSFLYHTLTQRLPKFP